MGDLQAKTRVTALTLQVETLTAELTKNETTLQTRIADGQRMQQTIEQLQQELAIKEVRACGGMSGLVGSLCELRSFTSGNKHVAMIKAGIGRCSIAGIESMHGN